MDKTTKKLLQVLRDLETDGTLKAVYSIGARRDAPIAQAVHAWKRAGYPDAQGSMSMAITARSVRPALATEASQTTP